MDQQTIAGKQKEHSPINCCSQGPSISQTLAIGLFIALHILGFNLLPFMLKASSPAMYALMAFAYLSLLVLLVEYVRLIRSDPSDPRLFQKYHDPEVQEKRCETCDRTVSETSYHCHSCKRCAEGFDHHCAFANNCIAKSNYSIFIRLLIALILHSSANIGIFIWLFLTLVDSYKWISLVFGILNMVVFVEITVLALFHCYVSFYLYKTTVQWIRGKQESSRTIQISRPSESAEHTQVQLVKPKPSPQPQ